MKSPVAVHFIAPSLGNQSLTFALSQVNALLTKAARVGAPTYEVTEHGSAGSRRLALFCHPPAYVVTADTDATRDAEDTAGQAYEGTHELNPMEQQRNSAGLSYDEGTES